ncbi:NUDIX hydrolase [Leucobacter sp. 1207-22]|uniref:NUDIX hydrolase n=1 Tax=Leucobacter sp. 1207-22 TaxID=2604456 RepID=UPI00406325F5
MSANETQDFEQIIRVSAVVIRDETGRVLHVRKRGTDMFMLPGGKPEVGEAALDTAVREISEELELTLDATELRPLGVFRSAAANEAGFIVEAAVFVAPTVPGAESAVPQAEIEAIEWILPATTRSDVAPLNHDHVFPALLAQDHTE